MKTNLEPKISKEEFKEAFPKLFEEVKAEGLAEGVRKATSREPDPSPPTERVITDEEGRLAMAEVKRLQLAAGIPSAVKRVWESNPEIRAEFRTIEAFRAFKVAEGKGKISIIGRGVNNEN